MKRKFFGWFSALTPAEVRHLKSLTRRIAKHIVALDIANKEITKLKSRARCRIWYDENMRKEPIRLKRHHPTAIEYLIRDAIKARNKD